MCVRAGVRACVRTCACVRACVRACVCVCKLRELLVCLLCNCCILSNCSLSFKTYRMCYCVSLSDDVDNQSVHVHDEPRFNFSDEIIK